MVFTTMQATLAALKAASELACELDACIELLVPHVVPYPRPLQSPTVPAEFIERRFRTLARDQAVETCVQIHLCRDKESHTLEALLPQSLVVIGASRRWFPPEKRLAKALEARGVHVVFIEAR